MSPLVFARLGFKINTTLSEIQRRELSALDTVWLNLPESKIDVIDALKDKVNYYNNELNHPTDLTSFIKKGFEYRLKNEDPTIQQIVEDLNLELVDDNHLQLLLDKIDVPNPSKEQLKTITDVFIAIGKGFALRKLIDNFEKLYTVADRNRHYFSKIFLPVNERTLIDEIGNAQLLNECGFTIDLTLKDFENREKKIDRLKIEFEAIQSPDIVKTINDRIETFNNKVKESENRSFYGDSLQRIGYLHALRGENPSLFELIVTNKGSVNQLVYSYTNEFDGDKVSNSKKILRYILEGYAYSYHIKFLETELKRVDNPTLAISDKLVKLKWNGQKNQMYSILRELKAKALSVTVMKILLYS